MKLELIVPATHENQGKPKKAILPPLGMALIAALTPPDVEVSLTDENVAPINFQKEVDLVGITSLTSTSQRAYKIADTFRAMGKKVVLGGIHPSILTRRELDERLYGEILGFPEKILTEDGPLALLRQKLALEPSINGGKQTQ